MMWWENFKLWENESVVRRKMSDAERLWLVHRSVVARAYYPLSRVVILVDFRGDYVPQLLAKE